MKTNQNSYPTNGNTMSRRKALALGGAAAVAVTVGVGGNKLHQAEQAKETALEAQLSEKIGPAMNTLSRQVVDTYGRLKGTSKEALATGADGIYGRVDTKARTMTISGRLGSEDKSGGSYKSFEVVVGVNDAGEPNAYDPKRITTTELPNGSGQTYSRRTTTLAAPGGRIDGGEGWLAQSSGILDTPGVSANRSTDNREAWVGEPAPNPLGAADFAVEATARQLDEMLTVLNRQS